MLETTLIAFLIWCSPACAVPVALVHSYWENERQRKLEDRTHWVDTDWQRTLDRVVTWGIALCVIQQIGLIAYCWQKA